MPSRRRLTEPVDPWDQPDPALALAEEHLRYYTHRRNQSRIAYKTSEVLLLLAAAATTLAAALRASPWITATLAASSLVLTGLRKIFTWHEDWMSFGSAWAELKTAIHDYRLLPQDRRNQETQRRLVDKVNEVIGGETSRWVSRRRSLAKDKD